MSSLNINKESTYFLLRPIVAIIQKTFTGSILTVLDTNKWKIETNNTLWLSKGFELEIDNEKYLIDSVKPDKWIIITGDVEPETLIFDIYPPNFHHGTLLFASAEAGQRLNNLTVQQRQPLIYLQEVTSEVFNVSERSTLDRESDCVFHFLVNANHNEWTTVEHDIFAIRPMRNLAFAFIQALEDSLKVKRITNFTLTDHAKWGQISTNGHIRALFPENFSGCTLRIRIPFLKQNCIV